MIGWIYMEALPEISYPVVQGEDNNFYLHQTYEKNYNFAGTIFIDYETKEISAIVILWCTDTT